MDRQQFAKLFLDKKPVILAPLAGITDIPMRLVCQMQGFDLSYVEMISATALLYDNAKTWQMLARSEREKVLGVQLYGRSAAEIARATELMDKQSFETIDINMGCPVAKVVGTGAGSAMLKDPNLVYETCRLAREATSKPLSVKIRIGWDRHSVNGLEVADAAQSAGVDFITIHGRTRSEGYGKPVDLVMLGEIKRRLKVPVIGNGNLFSFEDAELMRDVAGIDGWMIARGALGNPWVCSAIKQKVTEITLSQWLSVVNLHLDLQQEYYKDKDAAASLRMRKQLIWYATGWPNVRQLREKINVIRSMDEAKRVVAEFGQQLASTGITVRPVSSVLFDKARFTVSNEMLQ